MGTAEERAGELVSSLDGILKAPEGRRDVKSASKTLNMLIRARNSFDWGLGALDTITEAGGDILRSRPHYLNGSLEGLFKCNMDGISKIQKITRKGRERTAGYSEHELARYSENEINWLTMFHMRSVDIANFAAKTQKTFIGEFRWNYHGFENALSVADLRSNANRRHSAHYYEIAAAFADQVYMVSRDVFWQEARLECLMKAADTFPNNGKAAINRLNRGIAESANEILHETAGDNLYPTEKKLYFAHMLYHKSGSFVNSGKRDKSIDFKAIALEYLFVLTKDKEYKELQLKQLEASAVKHEAKRYNDSIGIYSTLSDISLRRHFKADDSGLTWESKRHLADYHRFEAAAARLLARHDAKYRSAGAFLASQSFLA